MEMSLLKALLHNISYFFHLSSYDNTRVEPYHKYYQKVEEMLKVLKPILDAIVDSEVASDEFLITAFEELSQAVDELRELFENRQPFSSKLYFVVQIELLISKTRTSGLNIFRLLKFSHQNLPDELSSASIELCAQKIKHILYEQLSSVITEGTRDQNDGVGPSSEILAKIADNLSLKSNQEVLIEAVALEKLKESAEQAENAEEADYVDQMIALVIHMHERLVLAKQPQCCSPVPIPTDFCCPLSLDLMADPVIVSSGQTYERVFIRKWFDLGLIVCPKTRQSLAHTNLIPNYNVKALIANWCELNNVTLPNPMNLDQPLSIVVAHAESDALRDSHALSSSPDIAENVQALDIGRVSLTSSEEMDMTDYQASVSPLSMTVSSNAVGAEEQFCSVSSSISNLNPQETPEDANEDRADTSSQLEARPRNQATRRHPPERFVPRIVPSPVEARPDLTGIETQVKKLVDDLKSTSVETQRDATRELRILSKHSTDNRIVIANCNAFPSLVHLLSSTNLQTQEYAVTALLNLSINGKNKTLIGSAGAIEPLIHVLKTGTPEAKENAAATLFSISTVEDHKAVIGRSGAIGPLVELLGHGTPMGKRDAATALYNLSLYPENKLRIVEAGAVQHLVELMDPAAGIVEKAVAVLSNLSTIPEGMTAIGQGGGIRGLVEVVELGSARGKENAAAALLRLCMKSRTYRSLAIREGAIPPLVALSQTGTSRAREKALALLNWFRDQRHGNSVRG